MDISLDSLNNLVDLEELSLEKSPIAAQKVNKILS